MRGKEAQLALEVAQHDGSWPGSLVQWQNVVTENSKTEPGKHYNSH